MIWYEFNRDNGDGSWTVLRFETKEEAEETLEWLEENQPYFLSDGEGVKTVDTESIWFFSTLEEFIDPA